MLIYVCMIHVRTLRKKLVLSDIQSMDDEACAQQLARAVQMTSKEAMAARNAAAAAAASPLTSSQVPASPAVFQQVNHAVITICYSCITALVSKSCQLRMCQMQCAYFMAFARSGLCVMFDAGCVFVSQPRDKPLHGVIISVAKKLIAKQTEYNKIAASLGAEYRWSYVPSCTHYIFQVRA